ncbi:glycosyltransferase family 2 protein [Rathayibacter soli]|uniref:glycosyltransferase family 2 protein n=1 Tax=Rathayibacter soli TaxID=3144168 RepID=UPI0027E408FD|nr:glycosyltransferase family 2 protein [Glaciibacter superstes]
MSIPNFGSADTAAGPSVSVVIPTLNEARNLPWVIRRIPDYVDEVVLVDGHSSDRTADVARVLRPDVVVITELRPGKGAAIRAGFAEASGEIIVMLDADGSMDPQEIGWFVSPLQYDFDFVKGSRYVTGGGSEDLTRMRDAGNRALTALTNVVFRSNFSDLCYGYIALRRECVDVLDLAADGFEIETELVVHAVLAGLRIAEVPSTELCRISGLSNLHAVRDGLRVVRTLGRAWAGWAAPSGGARPEAVRRVPYRYPQPNYPHIPTEPDSVLHPQVI